MECQQGDEMDQPCSVYSFSWISHNLQEFYQWRCMWQMRTAMWNPSSRTHADIFLSLPVPVDIRDTSHLWPVDVMRLERAQAFPRALVPVSVCVGVCVCACYTPLQAVIHGGLFQTMPLYLSPFILAAGCLRAAGALWQILKEGSPPAAFLYEETQLEPWLYCLKGAVQLKVKSRSRLETWLNEEKVRGSMGALQIYCLVVHSQRRGE